MAEATGTTKNKVTIRLHDLRSAMDDDTIRGLLNRTYDPEMTISVSLSFTKTSFVEDCFIDTAKPKITKKLVKKIRPPSEAASMLVDDTSEILFEYFSQYKKHFGEEDSVWTGVTQMNKAVRMIKTFRHSVGVSNEDIIAFIRKIIPLWAKQLRANTGFPNSRPTLGVLFEGKRYYWSNRNLLYRQWAPKHSE